LYDYRNQLGLNTMRSVSQVFDWPHVINTSALITSQFFNVISLLFWIATCFFDLNVLHDSGLKVSA
jgi:hypothetical protein